MNDLLRPDSERRKAIEPPPRGLERALNDEQLVAYRNLEKFGWNLKFVRKPLFQAETVILFDENNDRYAILEENGTLNEDHDLTIREAL